MLLESGRPIYLSTMGELEPGTVFAGHRIEAVAGRGGMGVVYQATQLALDRTIALKVIAAGLLEDQTVRNRFVRESKVAASIDHPNVIPIYYAGEEHGIAYIAMRYVPGDDVRSLVRREGRCRPSAPRASPRRSARRWTPRTAAGLVHRDIKPANVLLTAEDHVYLTDFGLTKHALSVAGTTKPGHWVGTLDYVAPEQIRGERVDARADVYALGCLLFYMLTGDVPFKREGDEARLWAHLSEPPPKPSELVDGLPRRVRRRDRARAREGPRRALPVRRRSRPRRDGRRRRAARPPERERLVAKGAAAPVESETVTAAVRAAHAAIKTQHQSEAETLLQDRARTPGRRRPAAARRRRAGRGRGGRRRRRGRARRRATDETPPRRRRRDADGDRDGDLRRRRARSRSAAPERRPRRRRQRLRRLVPPGPPADRLDEVGRDPLGRAEGRRRRHRRRVRLRLAVARRSRQSNRLVRLDPRTGRPNGKPIQLPFHPARSRSRRTRSGSVSTPGQGAPDTAGQARSARPARRSSSVRVPVRDHVARGEPERGLGRRPPPRPHPARRPRDRQGDGVDRGSAATAPRTSSTATARCGSATPEDNTVYKIDLETRDKIPISVGSRPRQLAIGDGRVYVTNYNSSDLYTIDEESARRHRRAR